MKRAKKFPWHYSFTMIATIMALANFVGHAMGWFLEVRFWFPFVGNSNYLVLYNRPLVADMWAYLTVWIVAGGLLVYNVYFGKAYAVRWATILILLCLLGAIMPNLSVLFP